ncbi:MaoC/PaaZ C-terminal domain-containing protein [Bacillus sp. UNC438CL73TsuS30]|uniref:MaoC/PaaZ C-terminal domain-containing protein n=1 Tax=Bacillus sp. UNC438CL73TsuS30 TaxID=1340434 RepID=UPI00047BA004|nr:MaoC/PaaZ C-terminal domain-containing protein [Bacillus sp. UNC438CL73TsuS30]
MLVYEDLQEGQVLQPLGKPPVTKVQLVKYAGASGDYNPLHTDDAFAQSIGMPGVIAHGMLVMGFLGEYVMGLAGKTAEITNFRMRFGAMTRPVDQITCSAIVQKFYEEDGKRFVRLELKAEKAPEKVVGSGEAILRFF